jgi:YidC/Oxa1 family membrane protein insertase
MWLQQKLLTPQTQTDKNKKGKDDNPAAAMSKSMQTTMPLMFGFFSLSFPAGLSIYFVLANVIGIGQGYYTRQITKKEKEQKAAAKQSSLPPPSSADKAVAESAAAASSSNSDKSSKSTGTKKRSKSRRKRKSARR